MSNYPRTISTQKDSNYNGVFTLLGCGTSTGVPMPGCKCEVCKSKDKKNWRTRSSGLIKTKDNFTLLIDVTTDFRFQSIFNNIDRIDAVFITHAHADHILGIDDLRGYNFAQKTDIPIYATANTIADIRSIFSYIFKPNPNHKGSLPKLKLIEINDFIPFKIGPIEVIPFAMKHGNSSTTGIRVGDLSYATDCNEIYKRSLDIIHGSNTLILDGLRFEPHPTHFCIPQAIDVASKLDIDRTILTHLSHTVEYNRDSKKLPNGFKLGIDGMSIGINL